MASPWRGAADRSPHSREPEYTRTPMRVCLFYASAVILLGCGGPPPPPRTSLGPQLEFVVDLVDLGLIPSEDEHQITFEVRNAGDAELTIERVDTSCGCAKPRFPKSLQPGESGEIVVGFEPEATDIGPQVERVQVFTNARWEPFEVQFKADLQPLLRLAPGSPLVVPIEPGKAASQIIALTPRRGTGFEVSSVVSGDSRVQVEPMASEDGGFNARLTIRSLGAGDFIAPLTIKTTHPRLNSVEYQIGAQAARGPVSKPPKLTVPALAKERTRALLSVVVVFARDRQVKVISARVLDPALSAEVAEPGEVGTPIQLTYGGGWKAGLHKTELLVTTDHPDYPELKVPIEVKVH